jgi:hypothetical protein
MSPPLSSLRQFFITVCICCGFVVLLQDSAKKQISYYSTKYFFVGGLDWIISTDLRNHL